MPSIARYNAANGKKPQKPFQFGLRRLFGAMFWMSAAYWVLNASRDALVLLGLATVYVFMILAVLYLDPSRDS